eukprot:SRR837773.8199.p1 GENE.SRR837773.8199~~SRR837773.8199.p1  ORF type:complete len:253 (-),score=67.72 SRR837773.8199:49-807(-)
MQGSMTRWYTSRSLHHTCRDREVYHLVMDLCTGGDLLDRVRATLPGQGSSSKWGADHRGLRTSEVCKFLGQMLKGMAYLHNYQFAHRDVKPENYLLESKHSGANIKLIDFGLARSFKGDRRKGERAKRMTSKVGSVCYVAPEVVESPNGYDEHCDIWSIGVTAWVMAVAARPFEGRRVGEYLKDVKRRLPLNFEPELWARHPTELRQAISAMLSLDPEQRPSARELLRSENWLRRELLPPSASGKEKCCSIQ